MKLHIFFNGKSTQMGGIETAIRGIEKEIFKEGIQINEYYLSNIREEFFEEIKGVNYIHIKEFNFLKKLGFRDPTKIIKTKIKMVKEIKLGDKILIFQPRALLYIPFKNLIQNEVILVQTNKFDEYFKGFYSFIFKNLNKYVDYFTVYTEFDKKKIFELFPKLKSKVEIIPRACKLNTSSTTARFSKKLIFIGRIEEKQKNLIGLIEVMKLLPKEYELNIYGDGNKVEINNLRKLIKKMTNISYLGPTIKVKEKLNENSIFLMTSRYEGFGNTLIEARSQGLPIVVYDTFDALKWIIKDNRNGFIIPFEDRKEFSKKIIEILENEKSYEKLSAQALELASETEEKVVLKKWKKLLVY